MKEFPAKLCPQNTTHFQEYQQTRDLCYLRRDIYEFLLHTDFDKDYFDTIIFFDKQRISNTDIKKNMIRTITKELQNLGWYIGTVFNQTAILIYPSEQELQTCFWISSLDFKCL
jgi:hypothetical protein